MKSRFLLAVSPQTIDMTEAKGRRYGIIDAARAVAIINMTAYHLCYDIFVVFGIWTGFYRSVPVMIWERFICCSFIMISGISLNFTRRGYFRGITVSLCGLAISLVMLIFMPEEMIWCGILSFLGAAMLITYALRGVLNKVPAAPGAGISLLLFVLCYGIPSGYIGILTYPLIKLPAAIYNLKWLAFLGFPSNDFYSSDYFPLLPWIFLFIFGYLLWRVIKSKGLDRFLYKEIPVLGFIGRHSLFIYMVHQPVLYGICYIVFLLINK